MILSHTHNREGVEPLLHYYEGDMEINIVEVYNHKNWVIKEEWLC